MKYADIMAEAKAEYDAWHGRCMGPLQASKFRFVCGKQEKDVNRFAREQKPTPSNTFNNSVDGFISSPWRGFRALHEMEKEHEEVLADEEYAGTCV